MVGLISEFSKITGYKSNTKINLYSSNEHVEMEIKNTIPFAIAQKNEIFSYESNKVCMGLVY